MASSRTLQDTITWAQTFLGGQPLNVTNMEPGLTCGNLVLERVLGPPMKWRYNRNNLSFVISTAGGTDYVQVVGDLGWIETQWLVDPTGNIHSLEGAESLPKSSASFRPKVLAPVYDDNAGNVTFRLNAVPTANDTVFVDYQKKAPLMTSYGSFWSPIPDEYGYIYNKLFLALAGNLTRDSRVPQWSQEGVSALLGAQKGLTAQERAIFLMEWDRAMNMISTGTDRSKIGEQALAR
jgi:hypothetical protein